MRITERGTRQSPSVSGKGEPQHRQDEGGPPERVDERLELVHPDVSPDEAVDARQGERGDLDRENDGELHGRLGARVRGQGEVEPQKVRAPEAGRENQKIDAELQSTCDGPTSEDSGDHGM